MKKLISILLLLVMMLSLFAGCGEKEEAPSTGGLDKAKEYLEGMYKADPVDTPADYMLVGVVRVDGVTFNVVWSADSDKITAKPGDNNMVTIDVPENSADEIKYVLTATISDADGNKTTASFNRRIPAAAAAGLSMEQIVELAYQLEDGQVMEGNATLTGVITTIKTPYDPGYENITVKIQIGELSDKLIECYRLKGEGADELCVGDTITVIGSLKNYGGTIEFDAGCSLDKVVPGERVQAPEDPKEIMDAAFALEEGKSLPYEATLTGKISEINTPYDTGYKNLSLTIVLEGMEDRPLYCYRMKGEGADTLAVGDTISVTGYLTNYKGGIQFGAGCLVSNIVKGEGNTDVPSTPDTDNPTDKPSTDKPSTDKPSTDKPSTDKPSSLADQIKAAEKLAEGEKLPYTSTITGKINKIDEEYSEEFKNITVTIEYSGKSYKVYRVKGNGADKLAVGDTITVTGTLQNRYGKVQITSGNLDKVVKGEKAPTSQTAIVDAAYALAQGKSLDYEATLTGKIVKLKTPYDGQYKNMTVVIAVAGREDKPIECFRMKGDKISNDLCVGDTITVTGMLKNYDDTIEFDAGCMVSKIVSGGTKKPTDSKKIVDAAFALAENESLPYFATLTGTVKVIEDPYTDQYKNVTLIIEVEGSNGTKELKCYRMKGADAANVKEGDKITVTGTIKNYKGTIEFDSGCTFVKG